MSVELIDARPHSLRLIQPTSQRASEGGTFTLLGKTFGFMVLPVSALADSSEFSEGDYTLRLDDSGEGTLTFPNAAGRKGYWRDIFDPDLALQFVEIKRDGDVEFVGAVARVDVSRSTVRVELVDPWALLRRQYEQDRTWTAAPQEVVKAYSRVKVPLIADDFSGATVDPAWTKAGAGTHSETTLGGRLILTATNGGASPVARIYRPNAPTSNTWRLEVVLSKLDGTDTPPNNYFEVSLTDSTGATPSIYARIYEDGNLTFLVDDGSLQEVWSDPSQGGSIVNRYIEKQLPMTITIERKGRWLGFYVNGKFEGFRTYRARAGMNTVQLKALGTASATTITAWVDSVVLVEHQDFLARGSDQGDYVLPGDQPVGGLRGRYWNHAELQGLGTNARLIRTMSPDVEPYGERLDPVIDTSGGLSLPLQPGNGGDYFAVRWFGSVYLRGDLGNYVFELTSVVDGVRLWVGKTSWDDRGNMVDDWTTASGTSTATWTASDYGSKAGWYPIILDYFCDTAAPVIQLKFTPPGTTYVDQGGTSITASTKIVIPASSLSPQGCFDNRVQGTSHFDMTQGVAAQFGYQITDEPQEPESGRFPGLLVPRLRVGHDTDVVLREDVDDRGEPLLNPGATRDGSDQVVALSGFGAGMADGNGSQVSAQIYDMAAITQALFVLEGTVDAADVAQRDLLGARMSSELDVRGPVWEEVRGTPRGQERLADTWPLTGVLSDMRWQPGDGVRLDLEEIGVADLAPRQLTQVTRRFQGVSRTGTEVGFRQRPRSAARSIRRLVNSALSSQRTYQGRVIPLTGLYVEGNPVAGGFTTYSIVPLQGGDRVLKAEVRISANGAAQAFDLEINGVLTASLLGGTWSNAPTTVDITRYAAPASATDNRLFVRVKNVGGVTSAAQFQLYVEIER